MTLMAERRKKPGKRAEGETPGKPPGAGGKKYPSREKVMYVGIPVAMYEALQRYARDHSDEVDEKSISWAARLAVHRFLVAEGRWPPRKASDEEPRE